MIEGLTSEGVKLLNRELEALPTATPPPPPSKGTTELMGVLRMIGGPNAAKLGAPPPRPEE